MIMTIYMVVTADIYELPVVVSDKIQDIADFLGVSKDHAHCLIKRNTRFNKKYRVIKFKPDCVGVEDIELREEDTKRFEIC